MLPQAITDTKHSAGGILTPVSSKVNFMRQAMPLPDKLSTGYQAVLPHVWMCWTGWRQGGKDENLERHRWNFRKLQPGKKMQKWILSKQFCLDGNVSNYMPTNSHQQQLGICVLTKRDFWDSRPPPDVSSCLVPRLSQGPHFRAGASWDNRTQVPCPRTMQFLGLDWKLLFFAQEA